MKNLIRIFLFVVLAISLSNCKNSIKKGSAESIIDTAAKIKEGFKSFETPVLIDSSQYVIYPLIKEKAEAGDSYGSSYKSSSTTYWNLVFYNTSTKQYHLLDTMKMIISFFDREGDVSNDHSAGSGIADRFIFYKITTTDFNKDGELDEDDRKYLYISDRAGNNFKQITPDSMDITGWHVVKGTSKVLIDAIEDTNHDKKFDAEDGVIPLVYDLVKGGVVEPVFNDKFRTDTKKLFKNKWQLQKSDPKN
ncbi:MAG TPA: hypothetical protein VK668_15105 [Mucilaginibacter sp.]|nr:hypothetical protein [Mucilaginibacter sp.]